MDHLFLLSPHLSVSQPRFLLLPVASPHTLRYRGTAERARCTDPICILKILHARIFPTSIRGTSLSRFWFFEECVSANAALALSPKVFPFCAEDTLFADLASLPQCHTPFQELEPHNLSTLIGEHQGVMQYPYPIILSLGSFREQIMALPVCERHRELSRADPSLSSGLLSHWQCLSSHWQSAPVSHVDYISQRG